MVGLTLKWLTGTPLVVDLRDLWTLSYSTQQLPKFVQRCHRLLEGFIFNKADRILTVSQIWRHQLQSAYPSIPEGCFATITNGFDPEDFQTTHRTTKVNDRFTITYTGALYGRQSAIPFFQALEGLVKEKPGLSQRLWVRFIGSLKSDDVHYLQMQPTLRSIVETQERVNHDRCLQLQEEADVLLLIVSRGQAAEGWYPSKVFEYLASNKPILTVAPNGAVKNLIKESGGGVVVDPDDISGIQQAILSLYNKYEKGQLTLRADPLNLKQFSRVELTCNLVRILNQLVGVTSSTTAPP
jgi:glycosyltransferase involved in cell wall biosynthesis